MKALVLDDDPLVLTLLRRVLAHRGYEVDCYADPATCPTNTSLACPCALREHGCPDLILTDVNMPSLSGIEFVEGLRLRGCTCRNIGMVSGNWSETSLAKAARMGVRVFAKPFDMPKLDAWLKQVAAKAG